MATTELIRQSQSKRKSTHANKVSPGEMELAAVDKEQEDLDKEQEHKMYQGTESDGLNYRVTEIEAKKEKEKPEEPMRNKCREFCCCCCFGKPNKMAKDTKLNVDTNSNEDKSMEEKSNEEEDSNEKKSNKEEKSSKEKKKGKKKKKEKEIVKIIHVLDITTHDSRTIDTNVLAERWSFPESLTEEEKAAKEQAKIKEEEKAAKEQAERKIQESTKSDSEKATENDIQNGNEFPKNQESTKEDPANGKVSDKQYGKIFPKLIVHLMGSYNENEIRQKESFYISGCLRALTKMVVDQDCWMSVEGENNGFYAVVNKIKNNTVFKVSHWRPAIIGITNQRKMLNNKPSKYQFSDTLDYNIETNLMHDCLVLSDGDTTAIEQIDEQIESIKKSKKKYSFLILKMFGDKKGTPFHALTDALHGKHRGQTQHEDEIGLKIGEIVKNRRFFKTLDLPSKVAPSLIEKLKDPENGVICCQRTIGDLSKKSNILILKGYGGVADIIAAAHEFIEECQFPNNFGEILRALHAKGKTLQDVKVVDLKRRIKDIELRSEGFKNPSQHVKFILVEDNNCLTELEKQDSPFIIIKVQSSEKKKSDLDVLMDAKKHKLFSLEGVKDNLKKILMKDVPFEMIDVSGDIGKDFKFGESQIKNQVLFNGDKSFLNTIPENPPEKEKLPILILKGTGGFADTLANIQEKLTLCSNEIIDKLVLIQERDTLEDKKLVVQILNIVLTKPLTIVDISEQQSNDIEFKCGDKSIQECIAVCNGGKDTWEKLKTQITEEKAIVIFKGSGGLADIIAQEISRRKKKNQQMDTLSSDEEDNVKSSKTDKPKTDEENKKDKEKKTDKPKADEEKKKDKEKTEDNENDVTNQFSNTEIGKKNALKYDIKAFFKTKKNKKYLKTLGILDVTKDVKDDQVSRAILSAIFYSRNENHKLNTKDRDDLNTDFLFLCIRLNELEIAAEMGYLGKIVDDYEKTQAIVKYALYLKREKFIRYLTEQGMKLEVCLKTGDIKIIKDLSTNVTVKIREACEKKCKIEDKKLDHNTATEEEKSENYLKLLLIEAIYFHRFDLAEIIWTRTKQPTAAALFACLILSQRKGEMLEEDEDLTIKLNEQISKFEGKAITTVNNTFQRYRDDTDQLLLNTFRVWTHEEPLVVVAMQNELSKFAAQIPCQQLNDKLWHYGKVNLISDTDGTEKKKGNAKSSKKDSKNVSPKKESDKNIKKTKMKHFIELFTPEVLSPAVLAYLCCFGHIVFLLLYATLLVSVLRVDSFSWLEYLIWAWNATYFLEIINQKIQNPVALPCRLAFNFDWWILASVLLFGLALVIRILAFIFQYNTVWMEWARVLFSIDFIMYSIASLEYCYLFRFLGPKLVMVGRMANVMVRFLLIILVFFLGFAVASESVLYPNSQMNALLPFHVVKRAFWTLFGEFSLDDLEATGDQCTSEATKYSDYTELRCPTTSGAYYVPPLMGVYIVFVNILLFNLLIALFTSEVKMVEEKAKDLWHLQMMLTTFKFSKLIFLPPPFIYLTFIRLIQCLRHRDKYYPFSHVETMKKETATKLKYIEAEQVDSMKTEPEDERRIDIKEGDGDFNMVFKPVIDPKNFPIYCNGKVSCTHPAPEVKSVCNHKEMTIQILQPIGHTSKWKETEPGIITIQFPPAKEELLDERLPKILPKPPKPPKTPKPHKTKSKSKRKFFAVRTIYKYGLRWKIVAMKKKQLKKYEKWGRDHDDIDAIRSARAEMVQPDRNQ